MEEKYRNTIGAVIEKGPMDWQVLQQDEHGAADIRLAGRWSAAGPFKKACVMVRMVDEDRMQPVTRSLEWLPACTESNGRWSCKLADVPAGGLYRLETALQLDDGPVEWAGRGDMRHHIGVGDVWIAAGQSNAAGYGKTPCFDAPEPGVHMFHASGRWRLATHPLSDSTGAIYPLNMEGGNGSHSPLLTFGKRLKGALGHPIGLIPAALGGSTLGRWVRAVNGDLFDNMLEMLDDAGGKCRGMVWYQGESDTGAGVCASYLKKFRRMVDDLRRCLNKPNLPIITAQLNRYIGEPFDSPAHKGWEAVREAQRRAAREIPGVAIISTLDLGLSDGIHNSSGANLVIGERMAEAALGSAFELDVKWRCPDLETARLVCDNMIELTFQHVDTRLHFENNIPGQFPFRIRDCKGEVPVKGWKITGKNLMEIEVVRAPAKDAEITGAPTACPPQIVPVDICGYRPMLAFTATIVKKDSPQENTT